MSYQELNNPSDLFFAIGDAILAAGLGVSVGNYDDFSGEVSDATVLIEIEGTGPALRGNDGRHGHQVSVTLHAVVARWRKHSTLEAVNLATCLERLVKDNRWGLPGVQCGVPEDQHSAPSMFQVGDGGYNAWGTRFTQWISLGKPFMDDPEVKGLPLVAYAWEVTSLDDPAQYKPIGEAWP